MGGGAAPSVEGAPDALPAQASAPDGGADAQRADPPADAGPAVNAWGLQTGNRLYRIDSVTSPDPACARAVMTQVGKSRTVEAGGNLLRVHGTGTSDGTAALLDFGQAKLADDGTGVATKKNTLQTMPGIVPGAYCTWSEQLVTAFRATASPPAVTLDVKVTEEKFAGCGAGDVARMMALSGCELSFVLRPL